jgi:hypothetical protein
MTDTELSATEPFEPPATAERRFGLPAGFLRTARRRPDGPPFHKFSRKAIFYRPSELQEWLRSRASSSTRKTSA